MKIPGANLDDFSDINYVLHFLSIYRETRQSKENNKRFLGMTMNPIFQVCL
jgi:hypothetical protein